MHQNNVRFAIIGTFKVVKFKFKSNIFNECSIRCIFSTAKRIEILNVKDFDYRCVLCDIGRYKAINILNSSVLNDKGVIILSNSLLEDRGVLQMDFGANKTRIEVIKYGKWSRKSWEEFYQLKVIDQKYHCSSYYEISVNKYGVKWGTSLRFWEKKGWINEIDPYGWFQWYFRNFFHSI